MVSGISGTVSYTHLALIGVAIVVKAGITMFAERQYWQDVADRFVKENVTVKPNRCLLYTSGQFLKDKQPDGEQLSSMEWEALTHFEGNANAFRLLTHQF